MLKKYTIHHEADLHKRIHHSLMYGALHHVCMGMILLYAVFHSVTGTVFHTEYYGFLKESITVVFFLVMAVELILRLVLNPKEFFKKTWNVAMLGLLIFAYFTPSLLILLTFRFFIYIYTFVDHPVINRVIHTFIHSIPTLMMSSSVLMGCLLCYGLLTTALFGEAFPDLFGHIGKSLFSFIQLMTFDDWIGSVVSPVMTVYPLSWIVFFSFVLLVVFGVLNIFVGTIVNAMNFVEDSADEGPSINDLQKQLVELKGLIQKQNSATKS
ncbi:MAG: ion transporter [Alphaproteobacteria bacterium]|nr:ion transporter [Alphaproteobacteria bacterium]